MTIPIISVTGTKGKTTTVAVIADVLQSLGCNTLKVDTTGHFVNGERKSTLDDARRVWGLVPTVSPGRYLFEVLHTPEDEKNTVAVFEAALGSSSLSGLGYRNHEVGVFLNVYEDHLGSSNRLQTQQDIADAKQFIFERLDPRSGVAVFNADDMLVTKKLEVIENKNQVVLLPVGLTFDYFDVESHLAAGGVALTREKQAIVLRSNDGDTVLADLTKIPWAFGGDFEPSVRNLLAAIGAIYGYYRGDLPENSREAVESVRLDPLAGRLTVLKAANGATVIADYAHEKVSLRTIARLARGLTREGGSVIGVVRLAYDRTDELIQETGKVIAENYDSLVVYDKIDGHFKQPKETVGSRFKQKIGYTSSVLADAIKEYNPSVERILREDEALARAAEIAQPGDVVVVIVNDDIKRSIDFIQEKFHADFI